MKINKEKRYILIIGTMLLGLGLIYRFPVNLDNFFLSKQAIHLKEKKLFKYKRMLEKKKVFTNDLITLNITLNRVEKGLLKGKTSALAAVNLQNILKEIVEQSGVDIKTMQVLKPRESETGHYLELTVQSTLSSTTRQLKEIIYKIESSAKLFIIKDMKIRLLSWRKKSGKIQATFVVAGYMKT